MSGIALVAVLIGGIVEFIPAFMMEARVPSTASVTPYTPLELQGRDIYLREKAAITVIHRWSDNIKKKPYGMGHTLKLMNSSTIITSNGDPKERVQTFTGSAVNTPIFGIIDICLIQDRLHQDH